MYIKYILYLWDTLSILFVGLNCVVCCLESSYLFVRREMAVNITVFGAVFF